MINNDYEYDHQLSQQLQDDYTKTASEELQQESWEEHYYRLKNECAWDRSTWKGFFNNFDDALELAKKLYEGE